MADERQWIAHPTRTKSILERHGFSFKKSLGQNFVIDVHILDKMVASASVDAQTGVIEIGPGIGALTQKLAAHAQHVVAIEIDQRLIPVLHETFASYSNVDIVHADVLKTDVQEIVAKHLCACSRIAVVANLPYYVTSPILFHLLESNVSIQQMAFMVQKEVGDRISAAPGTKEYGSLSVAIQYYAETKVTHIVSKNVFIPPPRVDSCIVQLTERDTPVVHVDDPVVFFRVVRAAFRHRRKTLRNNLKAMANEFQLQENSVLDTLQAVLTEANIDGSRRAESLTIAEFARLSNVIVHAGQNES